MKYVFILIVIIFSTAILNPSQAYMHEDELVDVIGIVISAKGNVELERHGWPNAYPTSVGTFLLSLDYVIVGSDSGAEVLCSDLTIITLDTAREHWPGAACSSPAELIICGDFGCRFRPLNIEEIWDYYQFGTLNTVQLPDGSPEGYDTSAFESDSADGNTVKRQEVEDIRIRLEELHISNEAKALVLAFAYFNRQLLDEAIEELGELIKVGSDEPAVYYWRGYLYHIKAQQFEMTESHADYHERAINDLNSAIDFYPEINIEALADSHFVLGEVYSQREEDPCPSWEKAQEYYRELADNQKLEQVDDRIGNFC